MQQYRGGFLSILFVLALPWALSPDRIVLKNGALFEGTILSDAGEFVEIRIGEGQVLGVARKDIREIVRGVVTPETTKSAEPEASPSLSPFEECFVVENRAGKNIASCRDSARERQEKGLRVFSFEQQWEFIEPAAPFHLSWVETANLDGSAREILYREGEEGGGKWLLARLEKDEIRVEQHAGKEVRKFSIPCPKQVYFPLSLRAMLRKKAFESAGEAQYEVFEPQRCAIETRLFQWGDRKLLPWDGEDLSLFVISEKSSSGLHEEWLDAKNGCLRREFNGIELVGRRVACGEMTKRLQEPADLDAIKTIVDGLGRYRFSLPDPCWREKPDSPTGTVYLVCAEQKQQALLFFLEQRGAPDSLWSALSRLQQRFRESLTAYERTSAPLERVFQGRTGLEFSFRHLDQDETRSGRAFMVENNGDILVLAFSFPARGPETTPAAWEKLLSHLSIPAKN